MDIESRHIVGIGASAGGLEALQSLLSVLPSDLGFVYVIIQHLSPDYKSMLTEILSKHTSMPIKQVDNGEVIFPNRIYVIPPRKSIRLKENRLMLADQKTDELHLPIDTFFQSLAEQVKERAIAIVLSGTGSDGTNGIRAIKENDGLILVQSPESAKFDGMPKSALRTGLVDAQLSISDIALELTHVADVTKSGPILPKVDGELDDSLMSRLYALMKKASDVNFTHYKQATILRRVERRMLLVNKTTLPEYLDYLSEVPEEARTLTKEVLIGVTSFFREPDYFKILQDKVIREIVARSKPETPIRAWVAGCSTGEEAYSIAILFCEICEELGVKRDVKIFATDLDAESVALAGKGVYGASITSQVSAARLSRFFTRRNNSYVINRDVRKMLVFSPHNVISDPPFSKLDLISCRNMMIYFQPVLQKDLFAIFHAALKDEGFLFLGKSEAVGIYTNVFPVVDAAAKIFSHRSGGTIKGSKPVPFLQYMPVSDTIDAADGYTQIDAATEAHVRRVEVDTTVLERFLPACLVVNSKNELVYVYGDCRDFIAYPAGRVTNVVFDIVIEQLRIPVSTALKEAREKHKMVQYKDIRFLRGQIENVIDISAAPVSRDISDPECLYAVVFAARGESVQLADAVSYDIDHMAAQRIIDLEQELSDSQDQLTRSRTDQESVNEELQASNEELLTANEELQSSNEELQSVNEELYTVNSEYQIKLSELADMNDDLTNILATTLIGIIFVDNKLNIRRFTNNVTLEFNVYEQDIGRPINFMAYHFPDVDITTICKGVLENLVPYEREVLTSMQKYFLMRVAPFRTTENKILGCVITFVNTTAQRQGQRQLQDAEEKLNREMRANVAKSDFLSRMSHEIRTPMTAILGLSELMEKQIGDAGATVNNARQLGSAVKYMSSLVSDILEMSKIERSHLDLLIEPFSIKETLTNTITLISPRVAEKGLTLNASIQETFAPVYLGDSRRLQQVLMNFLTNAVKYTNPGGTINFDAFVESERDEIATICFVIADTGIGMSKEFMPELFKPFSRENRSDDSAITSMGLGLPIARSLVELMNGSIDVESEVGKGSKFTVRVKLTTSDKFDVDKMTEPPMTDLKGMRVLIAEDNSINASVLRKTLDYHNVTSIIAADGQAAVDAFVQSPEFSIDCVLMDMRMPKLDGLEATRLIRASGRMDSTVVPIIAVSANAFTEDLESAKKAGINEYLSKPVDSRRLIAVLSRYSHSLKK